MLANITNIGNFDDIIDTRSPAEFADDHIPGAINLPVLNDTERATVGTLHKQNTFTARREGAALIAGRIAEYLQTTLADRPPSWIPLVYCARGGQRSASLVEILRRVGWRAHQLNGGYKSYRKSVTDGLEKTAGTLPWIVIAGKTGVGKTALLTTLAIQGAQTLDLEACANHRGSVFGRLGEQPSQRRFESQLWQAIAKFAPAQAVFVESESRKIGNVYLPSPLLAAMRNGRAARIDAPLAARIQYILQNYPTNDRACFAANAARLVPFAGKKTVSYWLNLFDKQQHAELVGALLDFYDLSYNRSLQKNYPTAFLSSPLTLNPNDTHALQNTAGQLRQQFTCQAAST